MESSDLYMTGSEKIFISGQNVTPQYREIERLVEVSLTFRTCMAVIYFLTATVAFVSNLLAILLLIYGPRRSRQLNQFLANLGASDILFAVFNIPFTFITLVYNTWWLPHFLCPLASFVQVLAPTVAFYTLIAIGIGRYYVIVTGHELLFLTKSRHTKIAIILIWLFAITLAAPILFVAKISPVIYDNNHYVECSEDWSSMEALWPIYPSTDPATPILSSSPSSSSSSSPSLPSSSSNSIANSANITQFDQLNFYLVTPTTTSLPVINDFSDSQTIVQSSTPAQSIGQLYTIVVFVLTFILPVVTLTYLYGHIGLIVYKHQLPVGNESHITNQNLTQTKIKVVKMLLILVISFIICWSPAQIFYLMLWVFEDIRQDTESHTTAQTQQYLTTINSSMAETFLTSSSSSSAASLNAHSTSTLSPISSITPETLSVFGSTSGSSSWYSLLYYTMYFSFHWLSCAHTIINPFVYCFFSNNFQKNDLIAILLCRTSTPDRNKRRSMNLGHSSAGFARNNSLKANQNHNNHQKQQPQHQQQLQNKTNTISSNNNKNESPNYYRINDNKIDIPKQASNNYSNKNTVYRTSLPSSRKSSSTSSKSNNNKNNNSHKQLTLPSEMNTDLTLSKPTSQLQVNFNHSFVKTNDCVVSIRNHSNNDQPYNDV